MAGNSIKRGLVSAADRVEHQLSMQDCLKLVGAAVDFETCMSITAFCNSNGYDVAMVAFDMEYGKQFE